MMTTSDKELLKFAAKAAGLIHWVENEWNPLTDDGDALRLAVKLKLDVILDFDRVVVCFGASDEFVTEYFYVLPEPTNTYAATRRAIVRAAASIGEKL